MSDEQVSSAERYAREYQRESSMSLPPGAGHIMPPAGAVPAQTQALWEELVAAKRRVAELESAIRLHRDQRGDDRCWMDDEVLYGILPEGFTPPERDACVELAMCEQYIASRRNPSTEYVSPQRRIEELESQNREAVAAELDRMAQAIGESAGINSLFYEGILRRRAEEILNASTAPAADQPPPR